jgi:hypothetical protein
MVARLQIKRTSTPNAPPTGLSPGELSVEMADPLRMWVGVPTNLDASGKKLLVDGGVAGTFVKKSGDTMTGGLIINSTGGPLWMSSATMDVTLSKLASGQACSISGRLGAELRWGIVLGDGGAESGNNAGSMFRINRYDDQGAPLPASAMTLNRASGDMTIYTGSRYYCGSSFFSEGSVYVSQPNAGFNCEIALLHAIGRASVIRGVAPSGQRWAMSLGDQVAETGANNGSNFTLHGFNDAGSGFAQPWFTLQRKDGLADFGYQVHCTGGLFVRPSAGSEAKTYLMPTYLVVDGASGGASVNLTKGGAGANAILSRNGLEYNWSMNLGNSTALATGNVGSDFDMYAYDNTGASLGRVMFIMRSDLRFQVFGPAYKPGGGDWTSSSDIRIKDVLGDYTQGLDAIKALNPIRYVYKGNDTTEPLQRPELMEGEKEAAFSYDTAPYFQSPHRIVAASQKEFVGLSAQDTEIAMPELVSKQAGFINGLPVSDLRMLDSSALTFALINAVKELAAKVEALEARLPATQGAMK